MRQRASFFIARLYHLTISAASNSLAILQPDTFMSIFIRENHTNIVTKVLFVKEKVRVAGDAPALTGLSSQSLTVYKAVSYELLLGTLGFEIGTL